VKVHEPGAILAMLNCPVALCCGAIAAMPAQFEPVTTYGPLKFTSETRLEPLEFRLANWTDAGLTISGPGDGEDCRIMMNVGVGDGVGLGLPVTAVGVGDGPGNSEGKTISVAVGLGDGEASGVAVGSTDGGAVGV
jgi:hypothetical protein